VAGKAKAKIAGVEGGESCHKKNNRCNSAFLKATQILEDHKKTFKNSKFLKV